MHSDLAFYIELLVDNTLEYSEVRLTDEERVKLENIAYRRSVQAINKCINETLAEMS